MARKLYFVTGNLNKLSEYRAVFERITSVQLVHRALEITEIQGSAEDITKDKVIKAANALNKDFVMVEDSSLSISALGGLPGPYIKYFEDNIGANGIYNMLKVSKQNKHGH